MDLIENVGVNDYILNVRVDPSKGVLNTPWNWTQVVSTNQFVFTKIVQVFWDYLVLIFEDKINWWRQTSLDYYPTIGQRLNCPILF